MVRSASSFEMYLMPPDATYWSWPSITATRFFCAFVASGAKYTFTTSCFLTWFDHETVHVPSAMKRPSRNMPISTVIVAATVVERFAPRERHASETSSLILPPTISAPAPAKPALRSWATPSSLRRSLVASAALVAGQAAALERDHALAHLVDHLAVVGDHQDRRTGAVDAVEELHDPDRGVGVEVAGRLVTDEQRRGVDERARDRDALLLAARQLVRERVRLVREADHREHLRHLLANRRAALALHLERVGDVLGGVAVRQQLEVLEDAADVAAQQRHLAARQPREVAPADHDPAVGRLELLQQQPDQRRLAGSRRADDEDELALVDAERDVAESDDVWLVDLRHVLEHDHRPRRGGRLRDRRLGCAEDGRRCQLKV